jgi:hypothetical protein
MHTYDIETYVKNNNVIGYCVCFYINKKFYYEYGINCVEKSIHKIFSFKFKKKNIFIHNLNFDGFLIIEELSKINYSFKIFSKNLNIYTISIINNNKEIIFKCSYKILPLSLSKIAEIFRIENKMVFPYKYVTENNLYYNGPIPQSSFFNSESDYKIFSDNNKNFNIKEYTIKYCMNDIKITSFFLNNLSNIIKIFKINLNDIHSAPSLALKIFQKKFNKNIIKTTININFEKFARKSYFGGRCEVYGNPKPEEFIFHFDFSGMYAQCMLEKFPFGKYKFEEKINEIKNPGIY